jgi:hypothetical protein
MAEEQAPQRSTAAAPLWIIAIILVLVLVGGGIYLLHKHQVSAERDKYRGPAGYYCSMRGYPDESTQLQELR